jgi:hypothetical protein
MTFLPKKKRSMDQNKSQEETGSIRDQLYYLVKGEISTQMPPASAEQAESRPVREKNKERKEKNKQKGEEGGEEEEAKAILYIHVSRFVRRRKKKGENRVTGGQRDEHRRRETQFRSSS